MSLKGYIVLSQLSVKVRKSAAQSLFWTVCRLRTPTSGLGGLCFTGRSWAVGVFYKIGLLLCIHWCFLSQWKLLFYFYEMTAETLHAAANSGMLGDIMHVLSHFLGSFVDIKILEKEIISPEGTSLLMPSVPTVFFWCLTLWKEAERLVQTVRILLSHKRPGKMSVGLVAFPAGLKLISFLFLNQNMESRGTTNTGNKHFHKISLNFAFKCYYSNNYAQIKHNLLANNTSNLKKKM